MSENELPAEVNLPYFDYLLASIQTVSENELLIKSFGRHVHWGYWMYPQQANLTVEAFAQATEELTHQVCKAGVIQNNLSVLDVGCGFGGTIAHINENYQNMNLVGVNIDERQLARARQLVKPMSGNTIEFKQGNARALPFADQSFDVVLAVECIFHFPDREQFFKEAYRVLKPSGYLALSDFVSHPILHPFAKIKLPKRISVGFYGQCNLQYGIAEYRRLARKTGYKLTSEQDITANTLPTYSYLRRLARHHRVKSIFAFVETATAEVLARLNLLQYYILGFKKAE